MLNNSICLDMEVNTTNEKLWSAIESGQLDSVKSLIEAGAGVNFSQVIL